VTYVHGDLLFMKIPIVQQCNCLTVKLHIRYPWANLYATRRPLRHRNLAIEVDQGRPGTLRILSYAIDPDVICFLAHWDYGRGTRRIPIYAATNEQRDGFKNVYRHWGAVRYFSLPLQDWMLFSRWPVDSLSTMYS
jgi:hypothetical protein